MHLDSITQHRRREGYPLWPKSSRTIIEAMRMVTTKAKGPLEALQQRIIQCRKCPRLVLHRERSGELKRRSFQEWEYWSRPVPSFGDPEARVAIIGLAPAAHGGNRTGRMFTGDASARFLMEALYEVGFANQPSSKHRDDGLALRGAYLTAALRCAPPGDKPTTAELANCAPYLEEELALLPRLRAVLVLGRIAFDAYLRLVSREMGKRARLPFTHGARYLLDEERPVLYVSYHPSPRNHNTGRRTRSSVVAVLEQVREEAGLR